MKIQFDIPEAVHNRLESHPGFPAKRNGRMAFYRKVFLEHIESDAFKVKALEGQIEHLKLQLLVAKQSLRQK